MDLLVSRCVPVLDRGLGRRVLACAVDSVDLVSER